MPSGRKPTPVEFLNLLQSLTGLTNTAFAKACGKQPANMSAYLSGNKVLGKAVLRSSVRKLFEWRIHPVLELSRLPKAKDIPIKGGVYVLYDSAGNVLYIGKATNLRAEVAQTLRRKTISAVRFAPNLTREHPTYRRLARRISLYRIASARLRHNIEALLLRCFPNQSHNSRIGAFK